MAYAIPLLQIHHPGLAKRFDKEFGIWYLDILGHCFLIATSKHGICPHQKILNHYLGGVMSKLTLQVNEVKVINRNCASPILSDYNGQLPNHLSDRLKQQKNIVVQAALHYTFKITSIVQLLVVSRKVHSILTQQSLNWTKLFETSGSRSKF